MSNIQIRPTTALTAGAILGLVLILVMLATGRGGEVDEAVPAVNLRAQQIELNRIDQEIEELKLSQGQDDISAAEAQENAFSLFGLAREHGVAIRKLVNSDPEKETLGRTNFDRLGTNVEIRGTRSNVIDMLLSLRDVLGEAALISNVNVTGTPDDWNIQFVLTQYLGTA